MVIYPEDAEPRVWIKFRDRVTKKRAVFINGPTYKAVMHARFILRIMVPPETVRKSTHRPTRFVSIAVHDLQSGAAPQKAGIRLLLWRRSCPTE